jgi:hypothetical protein
VGLIIVVAGAAAAVWILSYYGVLTDRWIAGPIAAPILSAAALFTWYVSKDGLKADTEAWKMGTIFTPLLGAMSFGVDVLIGSTHGNYANFVQTAFHAGGPFGIVVTVLICPIGTIICAGSWARRGLMDVWFPKPDED